MLHYLGKSVLLFWPRLPSISKKLHEHANFSFGRKGFCHRVSVHVCVGFDERLDKRYNIWTEGFLSPRHQSSAEIKHHHLLQSLLRSGGLDSAQGTLGGHCCQTSELWKADQSWVSHCTTCGGVLQSFFCFQKLQKYVLSFFAPYTARKRATFTSTETLSSACQAEEDIRYRSTRALLVLPLFAVFQYSEDNYSL